MSPSSILLLICSCILVLYNRPTHGMGGKSDIRLVIMHTVENECRNCLACEYCPQDCCEHAFIKQQVLGSCSKQQRKKMCKGVSFQSVNVSAKESQSASQSSSDSQSVNM